MTVPSPDSGNTDTPPACDNDATEQFVWIDIDNGVHRISPPLCEACSDEAQPAETVACFDLTFDELGHLCQGPFDV